MKLRIIAGRLRGRRFDAPSGFATHPMGDRVRTALFNKLGDMTGRIVLDPFAGSGAVSFEAISRGAVQATAIERDHKAQQTLERNIQELGLHEQVQIIRNNCRTWSELHADARFDVIICDPPYDDIKLSTLHMLARHVQPRGTLVVSQPARQPAFVLPGLSIVDQAAYAEAQLVFHRITD